MTTKVGRNDSCPCGSGKKFKHCCESKKAGDGRMATMMVVVVAVAILAAVLASVFDREPSGSAGKVWSAEHGHYH